ncbi:RING finger [Lecanosticta acicola]|uniref:RING finger n=1 Tax=Lecanosticta acicola TaxID=111012 RepID=A0AAI8YWN0_9PEZI|nr:RING finger [Lecanosticta acicola]
MSGYEVEHNIPKEQQQEPPRRRPDLSTFFSTLDLVDTSGNRQPQNANSLPLPQDISAAFRTLANAFEMMRGGEAAASATNGGDANEELLQRLVESLMNSAEHPPTEVHGVSDEFIEQLERVPKKSLREDQSCPICANPFLDDSHPLVVRLPCHKDHMFDLECIQPWLKLNPTCPMDRQELLKKKEVPKPAEADEEEEYDDMYA